MSDSNKEVSGAENPEEFTGLRKGKVKEVAAGIPAVFSSVAHIWESMSVVRGLKALSALNQKDGYDCPGCAWPDPDDERSRLGEYCENGVKAIAEEATTKTIGSAFFAANSVLQLSQLSDFEIGKKGRIAQPMFLPKGATHYQEISWKAAFTLIAKNLNALSSPDEAVFYTSGRASNEAAFIYQLFVREFGTNNLPDCSNMCHESSGVALTDSVGIGKGTVKLEDFYVAEVIIILGQNPGTNHPRMLSALQKASENGAYIISVNPLPETGLVSFSNPQSIKGIIGLKAKLADLFLQVKINCDMALLKAIMLLLLEEEDKNPNSVFDKEFIENKTTGYSEFITDLRNYNLKDLSEACGVPIEKIKTAAEILKKKNKIIACWAMGLTQHKNAVDTIREVVNLLLLKGSIGKPGSGTCPVRGHSNVQGDRTMGIYEKPGKAFLNRLKEVFGFEPPAHHGYDTVESIHAMQNEKVKVFFALGGNFLSATPDTNYTANALRKCKLTVHVSTKLNRSHLIHGEEALILPCLARSDKDMVNAEQQFVSTENSMGVIQLSKGNLNPVSADLLSEPVIISKIAAATLGAKSKIRWDLYQKHYDHIRNDIEKVIPGFDNYNERVRKPGGFYLPNSAREGSFDTLTGKAQFNAGKVISHQLENGELMMMTIRSHDQFNTTIYGLNDRYRGIYNERRVIFMNEHDIRQLGFKDGEVVDIYNYFDGIERKASKFIIVVFDIPQQCAATYFPETNVLVPVNSTADKSNTPTSKTVVISLKKHQS